MPIVERQYRKIVLNVVFERTSLSANIGWEVTEIDEVPFNWRDFYDQIEIDADCEPDDGG